MNSAQALARFEALIRMSKEALEKSSLAIKVDLVDLHELAMGCRDSVMQDRVAL